MKKLFCAFSCVLFGFIPAARAAECGDGLVLPGRQLMKGAEYSVALSPSVWPIPVGQHFSVTLQVCAQSSANMPSKLRVDADMPKHRHGMNYRTTVKDLGQGKYQAEGLMFHMPGRWRFLVELEAHSVISKLQQEIDIP